MKRFNGRGRGAYERHAAMPANLGEISVLREEAVPWMKGVAAGCKGGGDDVGDVQVACFTRGRADANGMVGHTSRLRVPVSFGVGEDGLDVHLVTGADDPDRDLSTVGHEHASNRHPITIPPSTCMTWPVM